MKKNLTSKSKTKELENSQNQGPSPQFTLRIAPPLMIRIEEWAARHPAKPKTGAAIKMLVERGLQ